MVKKISKLCKSIFGYGIMCSLFLGGLTFFGYLLALIIGGDTAAVICEFIYKEFIPIIIYFSNIMILLGLIILYMDKNHALTASKKKSVKHEGEM